MKRQSEFKTKVSMPITQPTSQLEENKPEPNVNRIALYALLQTSIQGLTKRTIITFGLVCGLAFGLLVGWVWWPVEYTGATYEHLTPEDKAVLIELATNLNVYNPNDPALVQLQNRWYEIDDLACFVAGQNVTQEQEIKLTYLAYQINQKGCE